MVAVESYLAILVIFTDRLASLIAFRLRWISDETQPRWTNMVVPEVLGGSKPNRQISITMSAIWCHIPVEA